MDIIRLNAHAKINLSLEVIGIRPDGYHDIVSFMQGLGLHDVMSIEKCTQKATKYKLPHCTVNGIVVYLCTDAKTIPTDMDNLAFRAVKAFTDAIDMDDPEKYGYHVWDGPTLSAYIKSKYDIDLGVRSCQKLLHKMGFSLIRPQIYPSLENQDDGARNEFKKN